MGGLALVDLRPSLEFLLSTSQTADESGIVHEITARLNLPVGGMLVEAASVEIVDSGLGTATSDKDYTPFANTTVVFPEGSADGDTRTVQVEVLEDTDIEGDETVILTLDNFIGPISTSGKNQHELTITDDDFNIPPVASNDDAETGKDQSVVINVLTNDSDVDGTLDPATVELVQPQFVANFDGIDDKITWDNLGLNGTPQISKFIRFRTSRGGWRLIRF